MEYRKMGKHGEGVSLLGFGCMRFPVKDGGIDERAAEELLDRAYAGGINYFDTAWPYHDGKSEAFVGRVMEKHDRNSFYLATKLPVWRIDGREDAEKMFRAQLEHLRTDHIDFYLFHALNAERWEKAERLGLFDLFDGYRASGKIRNLGFSFHDGYPVFERILRAKNWDFCQIQYNYMDADEQAGAKGYRLAASYGVPLVVMEPLKGGSLAGLPDGVIAPFKKLRPEDSAAAWSFRWLAEQPNIRLILSGMNSASQLEENLRLFSGLEPLDESEAKAVETVKAAIRSRVRNPCTACRYCMPCPNGVDIPKNFRLWNLWGMYRNESDSRRQWHDPEFAAVRADNCVSCGLCRQKCPQKIDIPANLGAAREELGAIRRSAKPS